MKDIHTALKNIMEKTKVIAQRTNNLEHDFAVTKRDMEEKINDVRSIHKQRTNKNIFYIICQPRNAICLIYNRWFASNCGILSKREVIPQYPIHYTHTSSPQGRSKC